LAGAWGLFCGPHLLQNQMGGTLGNCVQNLCRATPALFTNAPAALDRTAPAPPPAAPRVAPRRPRPPTQPPPPPPHFGFNIGVLPPLPNPKHLLPPSSPMPSTHRRSAAGVAAAALSAAALGLSWAGLVDLAAAGPARSTSPHIVFILAGKVVVGPGVGLAWSHAAVVSLPLALPCMTRQYQACDCCKCVGDAQHTHSRPSPHPMAPAPRTLTPHGWASGGAAIEAG
jgi:hypothetical protein